MAIATGEFFERQTQPKVLVEELTYKKNVEKKSQDHKQKTTLPIINYKNKEKNK